MFESILIVCTGNICRSPIAERFLRRELPQKRIDSAGTGALINQEADKSAVDIAIKHGLSLEGHRGQQFTPALARQYDLILVMEKAHLVQVGRLHRRPEAKRCSSVNGYNEKTFQIHTGKVMKHLLQYFI